MGKKYKRKVEKIEENYDPLNVLPQEILDMIFGYLSVKDILKSSLVSWNWYNIIGKSECIERVKVFYKYGHEMKNLLRSKRQYQNIIINNTFGAETLSSVEKEVKKILEKFSGSIKFIDSPIDIPRCCELPKLRKLSWLTPEIGSLCATGLFSKMELIEDLKLRYTKWDEKYTILYKDILTSAKNLKVLDIPPLSFSIVKECESKLREFRCWKCDQIIEFLKMQSATLEILYITWNTDNGSADALLSVILSMPNLNQLNISFNNPIGESLPTNRTITNLRLWAPNAYNFLTFLENLQVLTVIFLDEMLLQHILSCTSLRKVEYVHGVPEELLTSAQYSNIQFSKIEWSKIFKTEI